MKNKNIIYKNFIPLSLLNIRNKKNLSKKLNIIFDNTINDLKKPNNFIHTLDKNFKLNFEIKDLHKYKRFKFIAIIGMGGSILGSKALFYFLKDYLKKNLFFFDDINLTQLKNLKNRSKTLFIIISKSGKTVETLSNFLSLKIVKKDAKNIIIISEKNNNPLYTLAQKMNLHHIEHRNYVGGRFSIMSEVGIIPAVLMGVKFQKLRKNSLAPLKYNKIFLKDSILKLACIYKKKIYKNLILLNYIPRLEKFLFWSQQLIAESLGKKGRGFLPVISNVPKDHHSLLQLYLDGPKDKIFYIFSEDNFKSSKINNIKNTDVRLSYLNNKSLGQIKTAQKKALIKILKKNNIPFREFKIKKLNEETLGELFSYFMLETTIIGKLANIDPLNQPAVEQIKLYTKNILGK